MTPIKPVRVQVAFPSGASIRYITSSPDVSPVELQALLDRVRVVVEQAQREVPPVRKDRSTR